MATKRVLVNELKLLLKSAEYIRDEWLENEESWPVYTRFDAACKRARIVLEIEEAK